MNKYEKKFDIPHFDLDDGDSPEDVARKTRQYLNIRRGPVDNLVKLLEKNGVIIVPFVFETTKMDGISMYTDAGQPVIFINKEASNDRKRFTIGHELGHLLMHIPFTILNSRDVENEADRFSAEFNFPALEAKIELSRLTFSKLPNIKRYWKMSMAFIIMRAKTLKKITPSKATNLMIELSRRGYRKKEPINVELDKPKLLRQMIHVHLKQLNYTHKELADMLCVNESVLKELVTDDNIVKLRIVQ